MRNKSNAVLSLVLAALIVLPFVSCSKDKSTNPSSNTPTDFDGNIYQIVTIGTQVWMAENLKTTHYRNGDTIPNVISNIVWDSLTAGAFCNYNNDAALTAVYGRLYNWYAIGDNRKIAPIGWHVASEAEWQTLVAYLGGNDIAGGKLKEAGFSHWLSPNTGATNESHFSALPGGDRDGNGSYNYMGIDAYYWTSTKYGSSLAWYRPLRAASSVVTSNNSNLDYGYSVRCVRD
jgi:uncharacterized protein (TIGR02145 family)